MPKRLHRLLFNTDNLLRIPQQLFCACAVTDSNLIVRKLRKSESQPLHFFSRTGQLTQSHRQSMAYSPSPQTVVAGSSTHLNRISPSPSTQLPLSKRDKKRLNMADRLTEISNNFTANRDTFYRQQLQAYQADINYIQQANPYSNKL